MIYGIPLKWIVYGVLASSIIGAIVYVNSVIAQRDNLRDKVANLEQALKLERATYEESRQQWQESLGKVEEAFAEAQRQRLSVETQLAGMEDALKSQESVIRKRGQELEKLRSDAIRSKDCCVAWEELLGALGWAEGDM